jgi:thiamine biosynthesis lipoprotein
MLAPATQKELTAARRAMGCEFSVILPGAIRGPVDAACAALDEVERLERKLSAYVDESELCEVNRLAADGPVAVDGEVYPVLRLSHRLSAATGGAFDAAAGALTKAWGFFRGPGRVPSDAARAAALAASGCRHVAFDDARRTVRFLRPGVEFNLGGVGKGYAIDRALDLLARRHGVRAALMQGGGSSLRGLGAPPGEPRGWPVEIGDPCRPGRAVARVWLRDRALGTSGADHQYFFEGGRRYGHILDPRTGLPAESVLLASSIAPTAAEADALSTAFFVMGVEGTRAWIAQNPRFAALVVVPGRIAVFGKADVEVFA